MKLSGPSNSGPSVNPAIAPAADPAVDPATDPAASEFLDFDGYADGALGLGPGTRVAVWVRGCRRRCPGCIAPELWAGGNRTPVDQIVSQISGLLAKADGLTISGGEPFDQAEAVLALVRLVRQRAQTEVLIYTGYTIEEIQSGPPARKELLSNVDILIDGPYMEEEPDTLQWRGSDNQRVHLLSPQAQRHRDTKDLPWPEQRPLSIQMLSPSTFRLIGIPKRGDLPKFAKLLGDRGFEVIRDDE